MSSINYTIISFLDHYTILFYFGVLSITSFLNLFSKTVKFYFNKQILNSIFIGAVGFITLCYFIKLYNMGNYWFTLYIINHLSTPAWTGYNSFSDTLIFLSLITTIVSWIYLSERYLMHSVFNIFYFIIFIICTVLMTSTNDLFTMFLYFEFLFLPSLYYVYYLGYSKKVDATVGFLLRWTFAGSLCVLIGLCYLYKLADTTTFDLVMVTFFSNWEFLLFFLCFFLGFSIKIPTWPFYYWLTKVHVEAPTGFSIFLSGFLVKTAFYCLTYFLFFFDSSLHVCIALCICIWGSLDSSARMWTSTDIKRLIAFATIQEMNLILIFFFFFNSNYVSILNCFLLVHGVLSTYLFFLIDQVQKQTTSRNILNLSGMSVIVPFISLFVWIALLIYRGFPVFIKFIIEWELLNSFIFNFGLLGFFFFFFISFFGVLGFGRIWFTILYGAPSNLFSRDFLRRDTVVACYLVLVLTLLNLFLIYF